MRKKIAIKTLSILVWILISSTFSFAQTNSNDIQEVMKQLARTHDALKSETENLVSAQWNFKESPERWSIAEVVEHLGNWELLWARELAMISLNKPNPELRLTCKPDSYYHEFIMEEKMHNASNISKPNGFIKEKDTILWFTKLRNDNIRSAEGLKVNLRDQFEMTALENPRNMYNVYIYMWGHVDRHIKQIQKVKTHINFPK
ncbi:MAG: hypothetical protein CFE22_06800 [Cytophagaceae bacterium BCCC1]|nr:MAG: hypothetical protein CFE22_06800 [Cytophagaceae bacterium BCCC1]